MNDPFRLHSSRNSPKFPNYLPPVGELPPGELRAVGLTSGVGSMLIGAKQAGFQVLGNIEWRQYYRYVDALGHNTFTENFPGAYMARGFRDLDLFEEYELKHSRIHLAMGHPECGFYSILNRSKNRSKLRMDAGDIPLFLDYVADLKPDYFVMDDLPKSFLALPMSEYHERLPDYDLFPEWISNYHYGNAQRFRKRMFMVGARRSEGYAFVPGEEDSLETLRDRIGDLESKVGEFPNHDIHSLTLHPKRFKHLRYRGHVPNWDDVKQFFVTQPMGQDCPYHTEDGKIKNRPVRKVWYDRPAPVITSVDPAFHPTTCLPFTIRERARIQGFPDDFIFYGTRYEDDLTWECERNTIMMRQTGKAMPVEFNTYVAKQIADHIQDKPIKASNKRFLGPNEYVDEAKTWYCKEIGYSNQEAACSACWLKDSCSLPRKTLVDEILT
jgi:DNA (cytosine-5)-methyltransferase 1